MAYMNTPVKITIWNGSPEDREEFDSYIKSLCWSLRNSGHEVVLFHLRDLSVKSCNGCWDCWVKSPGICSHSDSTGILRRETIHSDLVLFASPLSLGFVSWLLKRGIERLIPLLHPYIEIVNGEAHHKPRYEKRPVFSLLVEPEQEDSEEDLVLLDENFRRFALNFQTPFQGIYRTREPVAEVAHALAHT